MESAENREQPIPGNEPEDNNDPSLSKIETIALLNDSIDRLEQTIKGLSENSAPIPSSDSINTLLNTTQELADAVTPSSTIVSAPAIEDTSPTAAKTKSAVSPQVKTASVEPKKQPTVTKISKKQNLPLIVIGVIAIAIAIVAIFWLWLPKEQVPLSSSPELTTDIASNLEPLRDQESLTTPSIYSTAPGDKIASTDLPADTESLNSDPEIPAEILIPENLESPGRAKDLKIVTIEPELDFTPEQTLIVAIKTKIIKLTQDYPTELIESAKVDLSQNSLLINLTDEWYQLSESRQNKMANEMLKRSRQLSFNKLELKDYAGTLIARNPVIGEQIIILENHKE
ncbi:MAG: hypothetical protein WBM44_18900 [Waterburya sp.]